MDTFDYDQKNLIENSVSRYEKRDHGEYDTHMAY